MERRRAVRSDRIDLDLVTENKVRQLATALRSMGPVKAVRTLRRAYPHLDWPGRRVRSDRIELDLHRLEMLGTFYITVQEAATVFGVSRSTMTRRLSEPEYREAWEKGRAKTRRALRQKQIDRAMEGSDRMLIWLGKQLLGQANEPAEELPLEELLREQTIDMDDFEKILDEAEAEILAGLTT